MAWNIFYNGGLPLPSWVPAAGEVATYTGGGSVLTNNFRSVSNAAGIGTYDDFYNKKVTDYSSFQLHSTWRTYGGMVIWGGGHGATNYNGMNMLTFAQSTMYFEHLLTPFNWTADDDTGNTDAQITPTYGECDGSSPLRIAAGHTYGIPEVINGKLIQPFTSALGYTGLESTQAAYELDLTNPSTSYSSRAWVRRTSSTGALNPLSSPSFCRYVPAQDKMFIMTAGGGAPYELAWFNLATNAWTTGTGSGFNKGDGSNDEGALMFVPSRDLLVGMYRSSGGSLVVQYANVASGVSQPSVLTATLSSTVTVPLYWGSATWCSDNNRLLLFGISSTQVYEIEIPSTLSNNWTVASYTYPNSATITPKDSSVYGKSCQYNPKTKCCVFIPSTGSGLVDTGNDVITVYRPRNT
jgi:hypothetical protein